MPEGRPDLLLLTRFTGLINYTLEATPPGLPFSGEEQGSTSTHRLAHYEKT